MNEDATRATAFSSHFGITTRFPLSIYDDEIVIKHLIEDHGLPSDNAGERKCLF